MEQNNKTFGFTMTLYEFGSTIPSLWGHVRGTNQHSSLSDAVASRFAVDYMGQHPEYVAQDNAMDYLSDNGGETYNRCHCAFCSSTTGRVRLTNGLTIVWSNFQIADMDMWRGEAYQSFFDYLDKKGGFYYEVRSASSSADVTVLTVPCSAGPTHLSTASGPRSSHKKTRSISSTT